MQTVKESHSGVGRVEETLRKTGKSETRALFWQIPHNSGQIGISLKIGRYKKSNILKLYKDEPESEITLNEEELNKLIDFISSHHKAIKNGEKNYISLSDEDLKNFFEKNKNKIDWSFLSNLDTEKLRDIDSLVSITRLENILKIWNSNNSNNQEEFWQKLFQNNSWILSQIFSCPFIKIGSKFYCGGKEDDDKGGVKGDFLYKNNITNNLAFIEIKTPTEKIIGSQYRGDEEGRENVIYCINNELTGGINQILNQKKVYTETHGDNNDKFIYNPKCVLIVGNAKNLNNDERKSFELFRSSTREVEIITFDELFNKIESFITLLRG